MISKSECITISYFNHLMTISIIIYVMFLLVILFNNYTHNHNDNLNHSSL